MLHCLRECTRGLGSLLKLAWTAASKPESLPPAESLHAHACVHACVHLPGEWVLLRCLSGFPTHKG